MNIQHIKFKKDDMRAIDRAMMFVSVLNPLVAIPQAVIIYTNQDATNVSLATWLSFMLVGIILTFYAVAHNIKPMIINQILWFIVDIAIIVGIVIYG
ncbi:MAG TPA: hypothetical protein VG964_01060 [Candidatus Saccharimonadales bacterium]|jgi:hypothetical protein|nr:hypothetical protein [Candidatus Saccharimonadales bacterium]